MNNYINIFIFQLVDEDEEDVYTLSKLGDLFHSLFSTHKEQFLPVFDQLLIHVNKLLVSAPDRFQTEHIILRHNFKCPKCSEEHNRKNFQNLINNFFLGTNSSMVRPTVGIVHI